LPAGLIVGLAVCVLTIPVAAFAERFVERPGIAAGAWLLSLWTDSVKTVAGTRHVQIALVRTRQR
jgi:peptidoglycan/LPS O-acetylase OafA/YrhL